MHPIRVAPRRRKRDNDAMASPRPADPIRDLLERSRRVAVVGWSADPSRTSARVASYLAQAGYDVTPVNPTAERIDGRTSYPTLRDVPGHIDLVVVFRRSEDAAPVVKDAIAVGVDAIWLQLDITTPDGAAHARAAGIAYVEDHCVMVEHRRRFGG